MTTAKAKTSNSPIAYIGLGSNLGDRAAHLRAAIAMLRERVHVVALSSVYESEPVGLADQPPFWNMATKVATPLAPRDLLVTLLEIEGTLGRQRSVKNAPRIIDLDILLYGDVVHNDAGLTIPHPRMTERAFVLTPLVELEPELADTASGQKFADILANGKFERIERLGDLREM